MIKFCVFLHSDTEQARSSNKSVVFRNKQGNLNKALLEKAIADDSSILFENCAFTQDDIDKIAEAVISKPIDKNSEMTFLNCNVGDDTVKQLPKYKVKGNKRRSDGHPITLENLREQNKMIEEVSNGLLSNPKASTIYFKNCELVSNDEVAAFLSSLKRLKSMTVVFENCEGSPENLQKIGNYFAKADIRGKSKIKVNEKAQGTQDLLGGLGQMANMLIGHLNQEAPQAQPINNRPSDSLNRLKEKYLLSPPEITFQLVEKYSQNEAKANDTKAQEKNRLLSKLPLFQIPRIFEYCNFDDETTAQLRGLFIKTLLRVMDRFIVGNIDLKDQIVDIFIEGIDSGKFDTNFLIFGYPGTGKSEMGKAVSACMALVDIYEQELRMNRNSITKETYIKLFRRGDIFKAAVESYQRYFVLIPLNTCNDTNALRGSNSVFANSSAGMFTKKMTEAEQFFNMDEMKAKYPKVNFPVHIATPICLLDEIDKFSFTVNVHDGSQKAREDLSSLLDKSIGNIADDFTEVSIPSKYVFFLCTANETSNITGYLGSRLARRAEVEGYTIHEKQEILLKKLFIDMVRARSSDLSFKNFSETANTFENQTVCINKGALLEIVEALTGEDLGIRFLINIISNFLTNISRKISEEALMRMENPALRVNPIRISVDKNNYLRYISKELRMQVYDSTVEPESEKGKIKVIIRLKDGSLKHLLAVVAQKHLGVGGGGSHLITPLGVADERDHRMASELSSYVSSVITHPAKFRKEFQHFISLQRLFNLTLQSRARRQDNVNQPLYSPEELPLFAFNTALAVMSLVLGKEIRQDTIYIGFVDNQGNLFPDGTWKSKLILAGGSLSKIKHIILPTQLNTQDVQDFIEQKLGKGVRVSYVSGFNDAIDMFLQSDAESAKAAAGPVKPMMPQAKIQSPINK